MSCLLIEDGDGSGSLRAGRLPHWFCDSRCTEMNRDGGDSEIFGLDEEEKRIAGRDCHASLAMTNSGGVLIRFTGCSWLLEIPASAGMTLCGVDSDGVGLLV